MPSRPAKSVKNASASDSKLEAKAKKIAPKVTAQRFDESGLTNRVKGHVSARGKRSQAKKDSR